MTLKLFRRGYRVYEIPITYTGRGYDEGKLAHQLSAISSTDRPRILRRSSLARKNSR